MHILVTGATGLIGRQLVKSLLLQQYQVSFCTRSKNKLNSIANCNGIYWDPNALHIDNSLQNVDVVVHLAGSTIMQAWNHKNRKRILDSRVNGLRTLLKNQKEFAPQLQQIVVASAIGAYPDDANCVFEEDYPSYANNFLGEVTQELEQNALAFRSLNVPVSILRFGLVLSKNGGAYLPISKSVQFGVGSCFGDGQQWQSWIHITDVIGIIGFVIEHRKNGVFNTVAPNPVRQITLLQTIARILKKPLWLPNIPSFVFKTVLGERAVLLLASQQVSARKIQKEGFSFQFPNLEQAIVDLEQ
ncbi:MAG: TIGR01777 family oxidoreductase [Flavobacteriaceae bacterium]|nr:TIGR01777 family oxidoreductase [Flavobacteriaceae bacterium]